MRRKGQRFFFEKKVLLKLIETLTEQIKRDVQLKIELELRGMSILTVTFGFFRTVMIHTDNSEFQHPGNSKLINNVGLQENMFQKKHFLS